MKKSIKIIAVFSAILILLLTATSCGSKNYDTSEEKVAVNTYSKSYDCNEFGLKAADSDSQSPSESTSSGAKNNKAAETSRKLIRNASLNIQTKTFDSFIASLEAKVNEFSGYIEESSIQGETSYSNRYADITLKIPADKFDEFIGTVSELATVTNKTVKINDITASYIDTESHIKALEAEQESLLGILKKSDKISDTLEIYERLSEVNAELDSYKSTLQTYDNLVSYSTVSLSINEVERVTTAEEEGFFSEIKRKLTDNLYNIGRDIKSFSVWFISSIPYIVIFAVCVIIAVKVLKKIMIKRKNRKAKKHTAESSES